MKRNKHQAKPKGQRSDKPLFSRKHAIKRAKERYDLDLEMIDIERIETRVRQGYDSFFLEKSTNTRSVWITRVEGVTACVVYNNAQKCLSTFLPVHSVKHYFNGEGLPTYNPNYREGNNK